MRAAKALLGTPNKTEIEADKPKRVRRTSDQMDAVRDGLFKILVEGQKPLTVRQIYYRAVCAFLIEKTEAQYQGTVIRLLTEMRKSGRIPYEWIADATRLMRKPTTWSSTQEWLDYQARTFRRAIWDDQNAVVEVWCESGSLAGVLIDVTREWDVPLFPCNGQPSLSFLHGAGCNLVGETRPVYIYYVGDYDPAGLLIPKKVEAGIREFAPEIDLHFERVAVTTEQIDEMNLPSRPPKTKDPLRKNFVGGCVEAEAIPPERLSAIVNDCIVQHIGASTYQATMREQDLARDALRMMARRGLPMTRAR